MHPPMEIDQERVLANGIRRLEGKHIVLYTDVRERADVDELVTVFDLAIPQWCKYFDVEVSTAKSLKVSGFLMNDRDRFKKAGLIPDDLPNFRAGFNRGHEIWVYLQPGDYYTRHLLLHEGTHAFMQWLLGGSGPPWYSEGLAELLALHAWQEGQLKLNHRVSSSAEADYWGRPKKLKESRAADNLKSLDEVMALNGISSLDVESYAWSWAACDFLQTHPLTKTQFASLSGDCHDSTQKFTRRFKNRIKASRSVIDRDWQIFINEIDYGTPPDRVLIKEAKPIQLNEFLIQSDHGWQVTSFKVEKGDRLKISASGKFQVGQSSKPWISEANGITLDYYRGRPVGTLLMGFVDGDQIDSLLDGITVGTGTEIVAPQAGQLGFRINESPAGLGDNKGDLKVSIEKIE